MNPEEWYSLPTALTALLDPARVQEYVRQTGWLLQPQLGRGLTAVYNRPELDLEQISIPYNHVSDFSRCMRDALVYIAEWEKRPARDLLDELLLPPADLLRFQDLGAASGGIDVPLDRGLALALGARKILLAAACAVARPGQTFCPRTIPPEAEELLHQCRLVQTGCSGFALTVAIPLDGMLSLDPLAGAPPFGRRVTEWLLRGLRRLAQALERGEHDGLVTPPEGEPVVNANLCEGLLDLAPPADADALTVDVCWDRTHPPAAPAGLVRLRRDDFSRIETLARRLWPTHETRPQTLLGRVESLSGRMNSTGHVEGEVWLILLDPQGEAVRVRADLSAEDYLAATEAHWRAQPVSVQGVLRRAGRTARLKNVTAFQVYARLAPHAGSA